MPPGIGAGSAGGCSPSRAASRLGNLAASAIGDRVTDRKPPKGGELVEDVFLRALLHDPAELTDEDIGHLGRGHDVQGQIHPRSGLRKLRHKDVVRVVVRLGEQQGLHVPDRRHVRAISEVRDPAAVDAGQHPLADRRVVDESALRLRQHLVLHAIEPGRERRHHHPVEVLRPAVVKVDQDQPVEELPALIEILFKKCRQGGAQHRIPDVGQHRLLDLGRDARGSIRVEIEPAVGCEARNVTRCQHTVEGFDVAGQSEGDRGAQTQRLGHPTSRRAIVAAVSSADPGDRISIPSRTTTLRVSGTAGQRPISH